LLRSIFDRILVASLSPIRSNCSNCSFEKRVEVRGVLYEAGLRQLIALFLPNTLDVHSAADVKCCRPSLTFLGQSGFSHLSTASPAGRTTSLPQEGTRRRHMKLDLTAVPLGGYDFDNLPGSLRRPAE